MGSCQSIPSADSKGDTKHKGKPQIIVKSFTWSRDSHGLFDYESKTLTKKTLKAMDSGIMVRKGTDVIFSNENEQPIAADEKALIKLHVKDGNYWVGPCKDPAARKLTQEPEDSENALWMVIKSFKPNGASKPGYRLHEGDLLKLGRIKFKVKELKTGLQNSPNAKKDLSPEKIEKQAKLEDENNSGEDSARRGSRMSNTSSAQTCRICLGEQADSDDPFFSPCFCTGTMKYIHVQCLQRWLKSKLHKKETDFCTSVYWKTLECELCKKTFPSSFEVEGRKYDIVEIQRPKGGYLMMEILSREKNILRGIHIIKMDGKSTIRLGRGHDSDIRITDISVSRCHAVVRLDKGGFYIEDNNSKFGTLVHLRRPFALYGDYNNISLQVGRSVLSLSVKKNWKALSSCMSGNQVGNPIELDEDDLFGPGPERIKQSDTGVVGSIPHDDQPEVGAFDAHNNEANPNLPEPPSPINQGDDDHLSDIPDDDNGVDDDAEEENGENAENVENVEGINRPAEQVQPQPLAENEPPQNRDAHEVEAH